MGQALYRKHRPKSLEEVVGQEHITQTLSQALKQGRISHAYLFTGPRGVGKTSVARILAHEINNLPYTDDSSHIDIIEIDAASNRRIDEIRELREKVYIAPASAKYKVYIIDEVHMLTREAFNALLKTLEEPPSHVVFILATTDAHKLPDTIISRTQRFSFRPVEKTKVAGLLKSIAASEKLDIDDEALNLLAEHGEGSFRDSISLLDQAANLSTKLSSQDVYNLLGIPSSSAVDQLLKMLKSGSSSAQLMQTLSSMYGQGFQASEIAKHLGQGLRSQLVNNSLSLPMETTLELLSNLVDVPISSSPEQALEIVLLKALPVQAAASPVIQEKVEPETTVIVEAAIMDTVPAEPEPIPEPEPTHDPAPQPEPEATEVSTPAPTKKDLPLNSEIWPQILSAIKKQHNTLYSVVRMAEPDFSEKDTLKLAFAFSFHQKRLNEDNYRKKLTDIVYDLTGKNIKLECVVDKNAEPPKINMPAEEKAPVVEQETDKSDLSAISNIFGGAELLES